MRRIPCSLAFAFLAHGSPAAAEIIYSQTSLAGSAGVSPGLSDPTGLLGGPDSQRNDRYEIFLTY
jgi:hypothetical protein